MKIGLIREGKTPPDSRVVLTPKQVKLALEQYKTIEIFVQPSAHRCYSDEEYIKEGISIQEDLSDCDVLIGVKEIPINELYPNKIHFFFSHTIKAQPYNRKLLQAVLEKNIQLIDYECLTNDDGYRVIAFGRWAGIVGAHNGLYTWGKRTGSFKLKRANECKDYEELKSLYNAIDIPPIKIVVTGNGRVAQGSIEVLNAAGIKQVSPSEFLENQYDEAVFTQLNCSDLYIRKSDGGFDQNEFYKHPALYDTLFAPYQSKTDLFINAIFWDPKAPAYFTLEDMAAEDFSIKVIADITCDIAPEASVPSTIRPSTIANPIYGFDPIEKNEVDPFGENSIDVMAVDNLPNELPRDASESFGDQFINEVLPELLKEQSAFIDRASIAKNGDLTEKFEYLRSYVEG
ncbi:MAG: NAD(P)-dependent oxidoreductase [Chitinophagales bacterium]